MPYITQERRDQIWDNDLDIRTPGELNFIFTIHIKEYIQNKGLGYQTINDIVGALECCKMEFIRRVVNPYEDSKIKSNGDIY